MPTLDLTQSSPLCTIEGLDQLKPWADQGKPMLFMTMHQGPWELGTYALIQRGIPLTQVTRFLNNPLMRWTINGLHRRVANEVIPKSHQGAKRIMACLKHKISVAMMQDQKLNEGLSIPFFGKPAMTPTAMARLSIKHGIPVIPIQVIRLKGAQSRIVYHPALLAQECLESEQQLAELLMRMNGHMEQCIRQHPEQWFWVHRRYEKSFYKKS